MKFIVASVIVAVGIATGGFFVGGRYALMRTDTNAVTRLDRFTGAVSMCVPGASGSGCGFVLQSPPKPPARISN